MTDRFTTVSTAQIGRRALVAGAAWSAPAIVLATAAPAVAASLPACKPVTLVTDWTSTSWVRTSGIAGTYTWINPLGNGSIPVLTLTVTATVVGPLFTSLAAADLTGTAGPTGGFSQPGLDLSLNLTKKTTTTTDTGADFLFAFSRPVTNLSTTITDIDGGYLGGNSSNSGAERVRLSSPSPIAGTITNSAFLTGTGTSTDAWRRRPNSTPNVSGLAKTSNAGNVAVASAALSSFTLGFRLLDTTSGSFPNSYNLWLTPFTFTLLCP
jgi:hypothetical protein